MVARAERHDALEAPLAAKPATQTPPNLAEKMKRDGGCPTPRVSTFK